VRWRAVLFLLLSTTLCVTFTFSKRPVSIHGNVPSHLLHRLSALLNVVGEGKGTTVPVLNLAARC
jgi:hypothetical protein